MARMMKRRRKSLGLPPGTPVYVGDRKAERPRITIIDYDEDRVFEREAESIEECFSYKEKPTVTWINIDGLTDVETIEKVGGHFGLHPLVLEDIVNTGQRPKMEVYDGYIYLVLKMIDYDDDRKKISSEQVSLVLGTGFVISFQERIGDVFDPVRERIRSGKGKIRKMGADYLAYSLIDIIVDSYFIILEKLGDRTEDLEGQLLDNPSTNTLQKIHTLKRELLFLRKSTWPLREEISKLYREESSLVTETTGIYLRDVHDHTIQVIDTVETLRDMVSGMLDTYLSSISNRMNEVMKVLTIIATIFIPLTYIAGIYGMNFRYMPELGSRWGYPGTMVVMLAVAALMVLYFKRRKWL